MNRAERIGFNVEHDDGTEITYIVAKRIAPGYQNPYYLVDVTNMVVVDYKCYKSIETIEKRFKRLLRQNKIRHFDKVTIFISYWI